MKVVARAPNHLGDGVMALPALTALASATELTIQAPAWGTALYRDLPATLVARESWVDADAAVLFPPSLRVAWQARRLPRRIGVASDGRRWLLTDVVPEGRHQADTYAALVEVLGLQAHGAPRFTWRPGDGGLDVPAGHIGLNPVSPSGEVREWRGFGSLAARLDAPVVFYGGPGETDRVARLAGGHPMRVGLALPAFAGALSHCAVFVSNDSGAAHFARACGVPTVVVHGSTTPERSGPAGARSVEGSARCRPCGKQRCRQRRPWRRLRGPAPLACLDVPVEAVVEAIAAVVEAPR